MKTPERGAATSVYLASSPEVEGVTGGTSILAGRGIAKRSAAPGNLAAGISGAELRRGSDARHLCFVTCPDCGAIGGATPSPSEATTAWPSVSLK
jgi:hypothetical protein